MNKIFFVKILKQLFYYPAWQKCFSVSDEKQDVDDLEIIST